MGDPRKRRRGRKGEAVAPTLEEDEPNGSNDEGHDGEDEEECNRRRGEEGKQHERLGQGGVAEEVLACTGAQQLRHLLRRQRSATCDGGLRIHVQHVEQDIDDCRVIFQREAPFKGTTCRNRGPSR